MKFNKSIFILIFALALSFIPLKTVYSGGGGGGIAPLTLSETDTNFNGNNLFSLFYFFDLRERETFIQLTYPDSDSTGLPAIAHVQIFDVSNNCNENDFFDGYTINDTHTYNMRDIQTNDGNPSGVVLPDGSYGIVAVTILGVQGGGVPTTAGNAFGNQRILDDNGYEYRTNAQSIFSTNLIIQSNRFYTLNFNQQAGITLSDVVGITLNRVDFQEFILEWNASDPTTAYNSFDVDIIDNNEVPFSCRDVIFSCIDEDNPRLEELLEFAGTANVASFEYGINNAIPHSKGGELLCPGNVISEGVVVLRPEPQPSTGGSQNIPHFLGYVGLNNGNGRGSMDSFWYYNIFNVIPTG